MPDIGTQNQKINHTTKEARNLSVSYEKFQFDHPRFLSLSRQSTCSITQGSKFWERCSPGIPWLMFTHEEDGIYKLLDPCTKSVYELLVPGLSGLMLLASFDGWLFAHANCHDFFFINPFSREKITLPISSQNPFSVGISASPTGPECKVFFISQSFYDKTTVQISTYQLGDDKWTNHEFECSTSFKLAHSNSIYLNGCFYSLGVNGNLGVYDSTQDSWHVLRAPLHIDREACFGSLVESRGKLLSIYFDFYEMPIGMFEFDTTLCRWKRVMNMGDRTFFYGRGASFCITAANESMRNMIYHSSFQKRCSLDLRAYPLSSVKSVANSPDVKTEYLHIWIQPNWSYKHSAENPSQSETKMVSTNPGEHSSKNPSQCETKMVSTNPGGQISQTGVISIVLKALAKAKERWYPRIQASIVLKTLAKVKERWYPRIQAVRSDIPQTRD